MKIFRLPQAVFCLTTILTIFSATAGSSQQQDESAQPINRIAAVVNNQVITATDVARQVAFVKTQFPPSQLPAPSVLQKQVLNQLVDDALQLQLAKKNNISVTDEQVTQALTNIAKTNNETLKELYRKAETTGIDRQYLREQIRNQLTIRQLQQQAMATKISGISEQEIDNYMRQTTDSPQAQKEFHVQDLLVGLPDAPSTRQIHQAKEKAEKIIAELKKGADFTKLAAAQSDSQSALRDSGDLGWRTTMELPDAFAERVKNMRPGDVAGPIRTPNGFHIIKLKAVRGGKPQHDVAQIKVGQITLHADAKRSAAATAALANSLSTELQTRPQDFATLARRYSQDEYATAGGFAGWRNVADYPKAVRVAVNKLDSGKISKPILADKHYYILKIEGKRQTADLSAQKRQQIEQLLFQKQMLEGIQTWTDQLRAQAFVKIFPPYASTSTQ